MLKSPWNILKVAWTNQEQSDFHTSNLCIACMNILLPVVVIQILAIILFNSFIYFLVDPTIIFYEETKDGRIVQTPSRNIYGSSGANNGRYAIIYPVRDHHVPQATVNTNQQSSLNRPFSHARPYSSNAIHYSPSNNPQPSFNVLPETHTNVKPYNSFNLRPQIYATAKPSYQSKPQYENRPYSSSLNSVSDYLKPNYHYPRPQSYTNPQSQFPQVQQQSHNSASQFNNSPQNSHFSYYNFPKPQNNVTYDNVQPQSVFYSRPQNPVTYKPSAAVGKPHYSSIGVTRRPVVQTMNLSTVRTLLQQINFDDSSENEDYSSLPTECGKRIENRTVDRVHGGIPVTIENFPWQVRSLTIKKIYVYLLSRRTIVHYVHSTTSNQVSH